MTECERIKNLSVPKGKIDVVLDTDTFNEIDDQFAVAYLLKSKDKLNTKAIYAAPFFNPKSNSPKDGMEKSYAEILNLLSIMDEKVPVFKGSEKYLDDETLPVISHAAQDLAKRANDYSPKNPLYVVAIGAITNIASAILLNPIVAENTVVVWLGGHAHHYHDTYEFNMFQDIAAARCIMQSGVPFIQLPCRGVVSSFYVTSLELEYYFKNKNTLSDYLVNITIKEMEERKMLSKVLWDVTAVAYLLNDNDCFMNSYSIPLTLPTYDYHYSVVNSAHHMQYVYNIKRDELFRDLVKKLTK